VNHGSDWFNLFREYLKHPIEYRINLMKMKTVLGFTAVVLPCVVIIGSLPFWFQDDIYSTLGGAGVPRPLAIVGVSLLQMILAMILAWDVVTRWGLWLFGMKPLKFITAGPEQFKHLDQEHLDRQTTELEQLGFVQLMDYTNSAPIGSTALATRLFAHPEQSCFATVGGTKQYPTCSISSFLEQDWELSVIRASPRMVGSGLHGFHCLPRKLFKILDQASPSTMFQTLLEWRSTVTSDLGIAPVRDIQADAFFGNIQKTWSKQLKTLVFKKSITWCNLKMFWAMLIPQTEWLGDYKKYQGNRPR
jgi:hypothetical protein